MKTLPGGPLPLLLTLHLLVVLRDLLLLAVGGELKPAPNSVLMIKK